MPRVVRPTTKPIRENPDLKRPSLRVAHVEIHSVQEWKV